MLWAVPDTSLEPELTLENWQAYETETGECHLIGHCIERCEGRVSSAITAFDPLTQCVETNSGRTYRLQGRPGCNADAEYVWRAWKRINSVVTAVEVTHRVWAEIQHASENRPT
jgi:hypothetical protein